MATAHATDLPPQLQIHASDRLGLTIFFAVVLHSLIILGISFAQPDQEKPPEKLPGLEVTLVQSKSDKKVDDADFLAQEDQEGGGKDAEAQRAASPVQAVVATGQAGEVSEQVMQIFVPKESEKSRMQVLTAKKSAEEIASEENTKEIDSAKDLSTAAQLLTFNKEIAKQSAEVDQLRRKYKKRKRSKVIAAATAKYQYASYEESFRRNIERIGTLNFPDQAKRRKLSGNVRVAVTLAKDGSLVSVKVTKFSGHKVLDDAAVRFVKMATFEQFPEDIASELDELTIVRTFQFLPGNKLRTRAN
jgi:protein TonB